MANSKLDQLRALREAEDETEYLLASPANKRVLLASIASADAGKFVTATTYQYRDPVKRRAQVLTAVRKHRARKRNAV